MLARCTACNAQLCIWYSMQNLKTLPCKAGQNPSTLLPQAQRAVAADVAACAASPKGNRRGRCCRVAAGPEGNRCGRCCRPPPAHRATSHSARRRLREQRLRRMVERGAAMQTGTGLCCMAGTRPTRQDKTTSAETAPTSNCRAMLQSRTPLVISTA